MHRYFLPLLLAFTAPSTFAQTPSPADLYGPLFVQVQTQKIFPDGKTFVDMTARRPAADIMADYQAHTPQTPPYLQNRTRTHTRQFQERNKRCSTQY